MEITLQTYKLPAPVWQVAPHDSEECFALLLRKQHKAGFVRVEPATNTLSPLIPIAEEEGSLELVGYAADVLLFHRYDMRAGVPEPIALLAYGSTGELRWEAAFTQLLKHDTEHIYALFRWQGREEKQVLELRTGTQVAKNTYIKEVKAMDLQLPRLYPAGQAYFQDFVELLADFGVEPELGVEYQEWKEFVAISFYVRQDVGFRNDFWLIDAQKNVVLQKTLALKSKGMGQATFWQFCDRLFAPDAVHGLLEINALC